MPFDIIQLSGNNRIFTENVFNFEEKHSVSFSLMKT